MATASGNTLDDLLSTTLQRYAETEFRDNIFLSNAGFYLMRDKAKTLDGGAFIEEPIMVGKSTAVGSYKDYDTFDVSAQEGLNLAEFNWSQYFVSITLSGFDEMRNQGVAAVIDLLESKTTQAKLSLFDRMNTDFYADGTGNSSKNLLGLEIAIASTGTYGGFARSSNSFWQATSTAVSGALTIARLRTLFNTISAGGRSGIHPNLIITTQSVYEFYEALLQPDQRFQNTDMADGGFLNLEFKGQPIVWDEACTAQDVYMVNTNYLQLRAHSKRNFATRPFITPANQDAKVAQILWMGQMTGSNCRRQGKLTSVTS